MDTVEMCPSHRGALRFGGKRFEIRSSRVGDREECGVAESSRNEFLRDSSLPQNLDARGKSRSDRSKAETTAQKRGLARPPSSMAPESASTRGESDRSRDNDDDSENGMLMRRICEVGDFVRRLRLQARFGELSRAPCDCSACNCVENMPTAIGCARSRSMGRRATARCRGAECVDASPAGRNHRARVALPRIAWFAER